MAGQIVTNDDAIVLALSLAQVRTIREALLVGLSSYGEVERLSSEFRCAEIAGSPYPKAMQPMDSSGDPNQVCEFAAALQYITDLDRPEVAHA